MLSPSCCGWGSGFREVAWHAPDHTAHSWAEPWLKPSQCCFKTFTLSLTAVPSLCVMHGYRPQEPAEPGMQSCWHHDRQEKSWSGGVFSWVPNSAAYVGLRGDGETLIIFCESCFIIFPWNDFLSNLIKTWTSLIKVLKKVFPQQFVLPVFFLFQPIKKAVFAIWLPSVVYGTNYNAQEQFGTVIFLLMRKIWVYKGLL